MPIFKKGESHRKVFEHFRPHFDLAAARRNLRDALACSAELHEWFSAAMSVLGLAAAASAGDDHIRAARYLGIVDNLLESMEAPVPPFYGRWYTPTVERTRAALSRDVFGAGWLAGQVQPAQAALRDVLTTESAFLSTDLAPGQPAGPLPAALSKREREVLCHLATGKTNREIADTLGISEHTVIRHVSNIFNKTGLTNRVEAAAFATRHGLNS